MSAETITLSLHNGMALDFAWTGQKLVVASKMGLDSWQMTFNRDQAHLLMIYLQDKLGAGARPGAGQ